MNQPSGGMWPTEPEQALLRVAIQGAESDADVWDDFKTHFKSGEQIIAQYPRLAPLLWTQLKQTSVDFPNASQLKAAFMHTWASNQYRVRKATDATTALEEQGIPSLMLKGLALLPKYPSFGSRPMADIDILVPESDFPQAMKVMETLGWSQRFAYSEATKRFGHAGLLMDEAGNELDLHWRLAPDTIVAPQVEEFWRTSTSEDFFSVQANVPATTYQLFHCMSHGLRWSTFPSTQWVADAAFVMKDPTGQVDWDRFTELAELLGRGTVVRQGLRFLSNVLGLAIPEEAMRQRATVPKLERREAWFLSHVGPNSLVGGLPDRWYFYRRVSSRLDNVAGLRGFWHYLKWRWSPHGPLVRTTYGKITERFNTPFSNRRTGTSG